MLAEIVDSAAQFFICAAFVPLDFKNNLSFSFLLHFDNYILKRQEIPLIRDIVLSGLLTPKTLRERISRPYNAMFVVAGDCHYEGQHYMVSNIVFPVE